MVLYNFVKGFVIRPGHENLVAMGAVDTIADESIRQIHNYSFEHVFAIFLNFI